MKLSKFCLIGLVTILSICSDFGFIGKVSADNKRCDGAGCNDKDPVEYHCDSDAQVVKQVTKTVYRSQDSWRPIKIIVQQIYSKSCHANWTKAYIPQDTFLFIRERDLVNGNQPIHGMFKPKGTGYFWAYGNMSNGYVVNQACVALVGVPLPWGGNSYDRHCTSFK